MPPVPGARPPRPLFPASPPWERACQRARLGYACGPWPSAPLPSPPQGTVNLSGSVPAREVMALVIGPLAAGQSQLDLGLPVLEVQRKRDQSQATLPCLRGQLVDLLAVHQQLTGAARLVVSPGALGVLGYVHVVQPHLVIADLGEPVGERSSARPQ